MASGMAGLGIAPHVVEAVLNHRSGTIKELRQSITATTTPQRSATRWTSGRRGSLRSPGIRVMGFTFDLTNMPSNEERMAESLAKIKDGLKGIDNPDVRSRGEESPSLC